MFSKREKDFKENLKIVFESDAGKRILKYLKQDYVNISAKGDSVEDTYYRIGQQDFVKLLLSTIDESVLDDVEIVDEMRDVYE